MNPNAQKIVDQLMKNLTQYNDADTISVLEMLYFYYRESHNTDSEEISRDFTRLNDVLSELTLKECDRVWDLTCGLCAGHEKRGFLEGVRVGAALAVELVEESEAEG